MQSIKLTYQVSGVLADLLSDVLASIGATGVATVDKEEFTTIYEKGDQNAYATDAVEEYLETLPELAKVEAWFQVAAFQMKLTPKTELRVDLAGDFLGEIYETKDLKPVVLSKVEAFIEEKLQGFAETLGGEFNYLGAEIVEKEDWENAWKEFYSPLRLSQRVTVCPSWIEYKKGEREILIEIDPGTAFGTGYHESTELCTAFIDELSWRAPEYFSKARILDLGTGSGILAIAAAKLGAKNIEAIDIDPEAVETAIENFQINKLPVNIEPQDEASAPAEAFSIYTGELKNTEGKFDFIIANLIAVLHESLAKDYVTALAEDGYLLLSGIIDWKVGEVRRAFDGLDVVLEEARMKNEWWTLLYRKSKL